MNITSEPVNERKFIIELNQKEANLLRTFLYCTETGKSTLGRLLEKRGAVLVDYPDGLGKRIYIDFENGRIHL